MRLEDLFDFEDEMTSIQRYVWREAQRISVFARREIWASNILVISFPDHSRVTVQPDGEIRKLKRVTRS